MPLLDRTGRAPLASLSATAPNCRVCGCLHALIYTNTYIDTTKSLTWLADGCHSAVTPIYIYICIYIYTYIHMYMYIHIHIYLYTYTHTHTLTYIYIQREKDWIRPTLYPGCRGGSGPRGCRGRYGTAGGAGHNLATGDWIIHLIHLLRRRRDARVRLLNGMIIDRIRNNLVVLFSWCCCVCDLFLLLQQSGYNLAPWDWVVHPLFLLRRPGIPGWVRPLNGIIINRIRNHRVVLFSWCCCVCDLFLLLQQSRYNLATGDGAVDLLFLLRRHRDPLNGITIDRITPIEV